MINMHILFCVNCFEKFDSLNIFIKNVKHSKIKIIMRFKVTEQLRMIRHSSEKEM